MSGVDGDCRLPRVNWLRGAARRPRQHISGVGPVAGALAEAAAGGPLSQRLDDVDPVLADLPLYFSVTESTAVEGFDTMVSFADEIHLYCDPGEDGLDEALAEQPGVARVFAEDREVVHVATRLHLDDVAAAVIRAVVDVNRAPREVRASVGEVTDKQVAEVADAVAPMITASGLIRRALRHSFHRDCGHGVVQVLYLLPGRGERGDGTSLHDKIHIWYGVCLPEAQYYPMPKDPAEVPPGYATLLLSAYTSPTTAAVAEALQGTVLPWLEQTAGREALAAWATEDPERILPPIRRPQLADIFTEWGHAAAARAIADAELRDQERRDS